MLSTCVLDKSEQFPSYRDIEMHVYEVFKLKMISSIILGGIILLFNKHMKTWFCTVHYILNWDRTLKVVPLGILHFPPVKFYGIV